MQRSEIPVRQTDSIKDGSFKEEANLFRQKSPRLRSIQQGRKEPKALTCNLGHL